MPKQKTNKAVAKRFKVTKSGKVKRGKPGRRHLLSVKTAKQRRQLRRKEVLGSEEAFKIKKLLGLV
jgi:large subunit ribosomal protein L35